jgi:hypothetical protein
MMVVVMVVVVVMMIMIMMIVLIPSRVINLLKLLAQQPVSPITDKEKTREKRNNNRQTNTLEMMIRINNTSYQPT